MKVKKERNYGIDLLRIVSMIVVFDLRTDTPILFTCA